MIVGFYGTSGTYGMCKEFGIVTAPRDQQLPDFAYDQPQLQNSPVAGSRRATKRAGDVSYFIWNVDYEFDRYADMRTVRHGG